MRRAPSVLKAKVYHNDVIPTFVGLPWHGRMLTPLCGIPKYLVILTVAATLPAEYPESRRLRLPRLTTSVAGTKNVAQVGTVVLWARIHRTSRLSKVRILLADDHPNFPEMEERLLVPEFEVIGKVRNGQALFEDAIRLKPDVIVTDISMPILNGIEAVDRLKEAGCKSRVLFLTVHSDADFVRRCLSAGAFGYIVKSRIASELVPAIREALEGNVFVSRHLSHYKEG
jgi:CheY-like chemotaxis protein